LILPDVNLLLYAYDASSQFHPKAAAWWSRILSDGETVGLAIPILFAFVRIATSPRVFVSPMGVQTAADRVREWLEQPVVNLLEMHREDVEKALELLSRAGAGANLTSDAQLAALALRHRAIVHTADVDFARFPEVSWKNPLLE
jgi:toxin-antitoxin system PIN domain toxin